MILQKIKNIWDNANSKSAYLIQGERLGNMFFHYKNIISGIDFNNKIIVDYGCGGGLLGLYLFKNYNIKKYIGYDISDLSLEKAKENLKDYDNKELYLINRIYNFKEKNPDIFFSLACIIHFPDKEYLDNWLFRVNRCNAEYFILEIRDVGKGLLFQEIKHKNTTRIVCFVNEKYLSEKLNNYILIKKTNPKENKINCQILWYKRIYADNCTTEKC